MAASRNCRNPDPARRLGEFLLAHAADASLCIALSGGRDSLALLHAAASLGLAGRLSALHVNHGLSPHAAAWAAHCASECSARGVPFCQVQVTVTRDSGLGLEAAARAARYEAFADCGAEVLLLAHHADDQAETLLFNLLRGSGVAGAAGMQPERRWRGIRLLRPWLDLEGDAVAAYAERENLRWIEDESNADLAFSRNFLRHALFPSLQQRFPGAKSVLARAAGHFAEAGDLLGELAAGDWQECGADEGLRLAALRRLSSSRLKNLLRWRWRQLGWRTPAAARLDEFVRQLLQAGPEGRPRLDLPDGSLFVRHGRLYWQAANLSVAGSADSTGFG